MKNDKSVIFQLLSALLVLGGFIFGNNFIIFGSLIPIILSIVFWYKDTVIMPIRRLEFEIKDLRKDLNIRKEIEDIKIKLENVKK